MNICASFEGVTVLKVVTLCSRLL